MDASATVRPSSSAAQRGLLRGERHERHRRRARPRLARHRRRERSARAPFERRRPHVGRVEDAALGRTVCRYLLDRVLRSQARHRRRWRLQGGVSGQRQCRHHERWWSDVDTGDGSDGIPIGGRLSARRCGDDCRRRSIRDRRVKAMAARPGARFPGPAFTLSVSRGRAVLDLGLGRREPQGASITESKPSTIQSRLSSVRLNAPALDQSARGDRSGSW